MRKLKLLIGIAALLLGAGNVSAQKDVTSQYIKNATLSSLNGWTVSNFNPPVNAYHQNANNDKKYSNATTGYASEAYAGWGALNVTSFNMTQTITLPAGHYTLVNYSFFRQGQAYNTDASKSLAYLKAGDNQVAIKTLGSITAAGYANSQWEGAGCFDSKMYRNTLDFTIDADNTSIEIGLVGTFDAAYSWCIAGQFELINNDIAATMDAPFDVTGYITNPGFEYRDMTGWTLSENGAFGTQNNNQSFKTAWYYGEKWQQSGALTARSMSQTLTDLPAGYYKLTANLGGNGTYIDLNGKTVNWTADKDYTVGYVLNENEDLVITAGKTAEGTANWIHFDNFRLQFCGDVAAALTTLIKKKTNYSGVVPNAVYTQLLSDVAAYDKNYSDVDELLAAIDAVQALYDAADAFKAPYAAFNALKAKANTLQAVENTNAEANSILATAITTQTAAADDATTASAIETATSTLKTAMIAYVGVADPTSGNRFDLTFMVTNPDLTSFYNGSHGVKPEGWTSEEGDGNYQVIPSEGAANPDGIHKYCYEYWSNPAKASGKFALYNAVTLPEGTFTMNCYAFAVDQYTQSTVDGVYFYANDTQGSCVKSTSLTEQSISFINDVEQEVKIGLKTLTGNTRNWMGIGYVELYKEYTDNTTYDINVGSVSNATVAVTVDDEAANSAKALKTVTLTFTPDAGYAVSSVTATYDDGEEKAIDVANPSENVYTFQMPAYSVSVAAAVVVDKSALATAISSASSARKTENEGTGVFQIPASAGTTLASAIATAQDVYDKADATVSELASAVSTLNAAVETYEATTLNAPDANKLYRLTSSKGILTYSEEDTEGGYALNFSANEGTAQSFTFTPVDVNANTYKVSFVDAAETTHYICTRFQYGEGGTGVNGIRTIENIDNALIIKIQPLSAEEKFYMLNTESSNNKLGAQGGANDGLFTVDTYSEWTITEVQFADVAISSVGLATFASDYALDFTGSNVKAYRATISGSTINFKRENKVPAGEGVLLKAEKEGEYKIPVATGVADWEDADNAFVRGTGAGVESEVGSYHNYVLANAQQGVGFYLANGLGVADSKAYLQTTETTGARLSFVFSDETTGINAVQGAAQTVDGEVYNLNGQRVATPKRGLYIQNGKKIIMK